MRPGTRRQRTDLPHHCSSWLAPIERLILRCQLGSIGHARFRLPGLDRAAVGKCPQSRHDRLTAEHSKAIVQGARIVVADGKATAEQHRPRIEPFVEAHDGDARLGIPGEDGALDWRRPAPARQ